MSQSGERNESTIFDLEPIAKTLRNGTRLELVQGLGSTAYTHNSIETDYASLSKACLSTLLAWACDIQASEIFLAKGMHGKPELLLRNATPPLHFNFSRSRSLCVVTLCSSCPIGVDIELIPVLRSPAWLEKKRVSREQVVQRFYAPREQELLAQLDPKQKPYLYGWHSEFLRMWTAKEAMVKAWGQSIGSHALFVDTTRPDVDYAGVIWKTRSVSTASISSALQQGFVSVSTLADQELNIENHFRVFAGDLATFGRKTL